MADIILKDGGGTDVTYRDVNSVSFRTTTEGETATFIAQKQADWNQTDETAVDFIKNKPEIPSIEGLATEEFVREQVESIDISEIDALPPVTTADNGKVLGVVNGEWSKMNAPGGGTGDGGASTFPVEKDICPTMSLANFTFNSTYGAFYQEEEVDFSLKVGDTYQITWDNNTRTCVGQDGSALMDGAVILGNAANFGLVGNGEEFIIGYLDGFAMFFSTVDTTAGVEHTVRIYQTGAAVADWEQNDINGEGYIHNRPFYVDEPMVEMFIPPMPAEFTYSESDGGYVFTLQPPASYIDTWASDWDTAKVTWDGTIYTTSAKYMGGMKVIGNLDAYMGIGNSGEPFIGFLADEATYGQDILLVGSLLDLPPEDPANAPVIEHEVSVVLMMNNIKTLDSKFIGDVPWDKVTNKPFGVIPAGAVVADESIVVTSELVPLTTLNADNIIMDAQYDVVVNNVWYNGIGMSANGMTGIMIIDGSNEYVGAIVIEYGGLMVLSETFVTFGVPTDIKVTLNSNAIKKIDSQYLPDDLGGGSGLPEVNTDNNNQVLTVVNGTWAAQAPASGLPTVSSTDNGKVLKVVSGAWAVAENELPTVTTDDAGKFLRVSSSGAWVAETIPNAEEVTF